MRAYVLPAGCKEVGGLQLVQRPEPVAGRGQVVVRVRAASLNYRDQAIASGTYPGTPVSRDTVPLSDGAGEIAAVGADVTRFKAGDRVACTFFQTPPSGPPFAPPAPLGSPLDGMLAERIVLYEDGVVAIPDFLSFEEASCLPCAGVTAWHALLHAGKPVTTGDTVLVLGTGGVSTLALQLATAAGAQVFVTSSSDEKLARANTLGAAGGVNYRATPEWDRAVLEMTGGRGVDCVIEVGGTATLTRSFQALATGGKVVLIGVLSGRGGDVNPYVLMGKRGNLHGIFVGDRAMFVEMLRAVDGNQIHPVVDRVFPFDQALAAYQCHQSGGFVGKIVIAFG
jgi:NADPH:quinone reductase-like Zn-dependent oxidoreductase